MGNLGEIAELVVNKHCYLEVGSDQYIGIESIRPVRQLFDEVVYDTAGSFVPDMVGEAEEFLMITLKFTKDEYSSFHTSSTAAATGVMTNTSFVVRAIGNNGTASVITIPGYVKDIDGPIKLPGLDYVTIELFIRITGGFTLS